MQKVVVLYLTTSSMTCGQEALADVIDLETAGTFCIYSHLLLIESLGRRVKCRV